jgi:hypothetical protein
MALSQIGSNAITDANITAAKIVDANITTAKIADTAITSAKMGYSGAILQIVRLSPVVGLYTSGTTSYAEVTTDFRLAITPKSASSILILDWVGLFGNAYSGAISTFKFYNVTASADIYSGVSLGSRTIGHGSIRQIDGDANDRDNLILRAVISSGSTTARTYTLYQRCEDTHTSYWNATGTDNTGCSYVIPSFTITEIIA